MVLLAIAVTTADVAAEPSLRVSPKKPKPGDPILVMVDGVDARPKGTGGKVPLVFFPVKRGWQAVFAVPLDDAPTELRVTIDGIAPYETLAVRTHQFPEEQVTVPPEMAEPPADKRKQIDADNAAVIAAVRNSAQPMFRGAFRLPGAGPRTSVFGAWRTLNGGYRSRHLGLDLAARKGAPVRSIQRGKVALVHDGFLMGGTVVIVHGGGIASTYFHLADIPVKVGDDVDRGAVIGKVSLTGRTTGPHIHLGVWVPGGFVDPAVFVKLPIATPREPLPP